MGTVSGAKAGYNSVNANQTVAQAWSSGKTAGQKAGAVAGIQAGLSAAKNTGRTLTKEQQAAVEKWQTLAKKMAEATEPAEVESIIWEMNHACAAALGLEYNEPTSREPVIVYAGMYYGFDAETLRILERVKAGIDDLSANMLFGDKQRRADEEFALSIGRLIYGSYAGGSWFDMVAWDGTTRPAYIIWDQYSNEEMFFTLLGLTYDEYDYLKNSVIEQHENVENADYAHYSITLAANLIDDWTILRTAADIKTGGKRKEMAGWLGDATIKNKRGEVTLGNDDYMADLDAANIASIMETNGVSMSEAIMTYQQQLESGQETRATIFLKYNSLEDVEKEILAELNVATRDELNNSNLAGAYNFICSLEEGLNELEDFVNE